jgi:hypothetical protein
MLRQERTTRILLTAIAFLLGANLFVSVHRDQAVQAAGIPDSGAQMQAQIDQLTQLNAKMDKLQSFLESGKLKVLTDAKAEK